MPNKCHKDQIPLYFSIPSIFERLPFCLPLLFSPGIEFIAALISARDCHSWTEWNGVLGSWAAVLRISLALQREQSQCLAYAKITLSISIATSIANHRKLQQRPCAGDSCRGGGRLSPTDASAPLPLPTTTQLRPPSPTACLHFHFPANREKHLKSRAQNNLRFEPTECNSTS
jgi:hypothetical protein